MDVSSLSFEQFQEHFSSEDACIDYVFQIKWPNGFCCPRCEHRHAYVTTTRRLPLYECSHCRFQVSLLSGTIMEGSRTFLHKWMIAVYLISRTSLGTTAVELSKIINVTYKTAWLILHKIRTAIQLSDNQSLLSGSVQLNSAIYGRPFNPSVHKHPQEHLLLVGSSVDHSDVSTNSTIKIKLVKPINPKNKHIATSDISNFKQQYIHPSVNQIDTVTGFYTPKRHRPLIQFAAQASMWLNTTFHGIGSKHLQLYLDEFCFRLNLIESKTPIFNHLSNLCIGSPLQLAQ
ncbi:IS1595 family transposase [Paenibacillus roseipurpureus]|uniref:IS1595 family transposase n=1 Tax=Paenibacillus roseopurpureus TaxID=2918901 RepID=A0AA96LS61_9BACL|nr:IS1595 family transposase [Paenibacillus sp. MBLB1832]WNR45566.1 IS1595 family transposase [Paenibacillus sp. MBLB1832]